MTHVALLTALAAALALCGAPSAAGPVVSNEQSAPPLWEQHGAGRKDGLAVSAYPLPPNPDERPTEEQVDSSARERWLRRHYQWLRALQAVIGPLAQEPDRQTEDRAFSPPAPPGALKLGDLVVLYAGKADEPAAPHLLDDGRREEDSGRWLEDLQVFEFDRPDAQAGEAELVEEFLIPTPQRPLAAMAATAPLSRSLPGLALQGLSFESQFPAMGQSGQAAQRRAGPPRPPPTLVGFLRQVATDVISAPTTYLLALLALLAWLVLRATVFSRP